jgi:hypothetical protein
LIGLAEIEKIDILKRKAISVKLLEADLEKLKAKQ